MPTLFIDTSPQVVALQSAAVYTSRRATPTGARQIMANDYLDSVEIAPEAPARASVIWLHGLGAAGHDFAPIEREIAQGVAPERILLAGFSQGGAIALHAGLRYPRRLAGIMALSTYLPLAATVADEAQAANSDLPIFLAHGSEDNIIALPHALLSKQRLEDLGYPMEWHCYSMAHSLCNEEIDDMRHYMARVLTAPSEKY